MSVRLCLGGWWVLTGSNRRPTPCKGAALPTELRTPPKPDVSVQRIFQCLARTKLWNFRGLYFNRCAGARIAACAGDPFANRKGAETDQGNRSPLLQCRLHRANGGLQRTGSRCLGNVRVLRDVFNQFSLVHREPLVWKQSQSIYVLAHPVTRHLPVCVTHPVTHPVTHTVSQTIRSRAGETSAANAVGH